MLSRGMGGDLGDGAVTAASGPHQLQLLRQLEGWQTGQSHHQPTQQVFSPLLAGKGWREFFLDF